MKRGAYFKGIYTSSFTKEKSMTAFPVMFSGPAIRGAIKTHYPEHAKSVFQAMAQRKVTDDALVAQAKGLSQGLDLNNGLDRKSLYYSLTAIYTG
jgi:hypothetical protein